VRDNKYSAFPLPIRLIFLTLQRRHHSCGSKNRQTIRPRSLDDACPQKPGRWGTYTKRRLHRRFVLWLQRISQIRNQVRDKATVDDLCGNMLISLHAVPFSLQKVRALLLMCWHIFRVGFGVARSDLMGNARAFCSGTGNWNRRYPRFFCICPQQVKEKPCSAYDDPLH